MATEKGDYKLATFEKNRLEVKQRLVKKYNDSHKIQHKPAYFDVWENPHDPGKTYYKYNNKYFEHDRPLRSWGHLPDIFSEKPPPV